MCTEIEMTEVLLNVHRWKKFTSIYLSLSPRSFFYVDVLLVLGVVAFFGYFLTATIKAKKPVNYLFTWRKKKYIL